MSEDWILGCIAGGGWGLCVGGFLGVVFALFVLREFAARANEEDGAPRE